MMHKFLQKNNLKNPITAMFDLKPIEKLKEMAADCK
jgi:hypothetical protein